ncbi:MAG: SHOCT domain-containing protein [Thaumarchaeota archaeon]|nr:MAG: SHOCT domain-containing protein [Nitrososphaerota archaeon]
MFFFFIVFAVFRFLFWGWGWGGRYRWYGHYWGGPAEILKERYARGEITKEQFEQMMRDLEQHSK